MIDVALKHVFHTKKKCITVAFSKILEVDGKVPINIVEAKDNDEFGLIVSFFDFDKIDLTKVRPWRLNVY